jgi:hypothetical protein
MLRLMDETVLNLSLAFGVLCNRYLVFLFLFMQVVGGLRNPELKAY